MRNLFQISDQVVVLDPGRAAPRLAIDSPSSTLYYAYQTESDSVGLAARSITTGVTLRFPIDGLHDGVAIDIQYLPQRESVCVVTAAGAIYLVPVHNEGAAEMVGVFDNGVAAAGWSADRECCAISTCDGKIVVIAHDWDVIGEVDVGAVASSISWRNDRTRFCAVVGSSVLLFEQDGVRIAKTMEEQFTHDTLTGHVVFRPSGDMITAVVDHDAGSKGVERRVSILEGANCLRHGHWTIPSEESVVGIAWSADSAAVAVALQRSVLIYERSNYRWYLKSEICTPPSAIHWDPERALRLYIDIADHSVRVVDFAHVIDQSSSGAVAVIDGNRILVTDFGRMVVPPPMSMSECGADANLVSVGWSADGSLAALTSHGDIILYAAPATAQFRSIQSPTRVLTPDCDRQRQVAFADCNTLVMLRSSTSAADALVFINITGDDHDDRSVLLESRAIRLGRDGVQLESGRILGYRDLTPLVQLPAPCPQFSTTSNGSVAIGLDDAGRLYLNDTCLAQSASSFALIAESTLLFTTGGAQHVLHTIDVAAPDHPILVQRHLERGAIIGAVVPALDRVVLQMLPRGSIETIYPRTLLLRTVAVLLGARRWSDAFHCMRRHHLDFNLLYDADPDAFIADVDAFVAGVGQAALLNEFIAALVDSDTRQTIYKEFVPVSGASCDHHDDEYRRLSSLAVAGHLLPGVGEQGDDALRIPSDGSKVNHICGLIAAATAASAELVLARLGALLKQKPGQYETVLQVVASLPVQQRPAVLRFVTSVVQVDKLFDCALGLYDFDLVRMVGRVSDRDPKLYLKQIRDLQALPEIDRRIAIDTDLRRFDRVLQHLARIAPVPFVRVLDLLRTHPELYSDAFALFPAHPSILAAFATSPRCRDAGLAFAAAGDRRRALRAYRDACDWRNALSVAFDLGDVDVVELARNLSDAMIWEAPMSAPASRDAAHLLVDICGDVDAGVRALCRAQLWSEALLVARRLRRPDLVDVVFWPALGQSSQRLLADLNYACERVRYCAGRLRLLQGHAVAAADDVDERFDERTQTDTNLSAFTLTSQVSVQSWASTPWSNISSVRRRERKASRRTVKMREGDAREPAFLMRQIRTLAPDKDKIDSVADLLRTLAGAGRCQEAAQVEARFATLLSLVRSAVQHVPQLDVVVPDSDWKVQFLAVTSASADTSEAGRTEDDTLDAIRELDEEGAGFDLF